MYSCYALQTIDGSPLKRKASEPVGDGIYTVDGTFKIVFLNGELLPIYDGRFFRLKEVLDTKFLIATSGVLHLTFDGRSILATDTPPTADNCTTFRYVQPDRSSVVFTYRDLPRSTYRSPTPDYSGDTLVFHPTLFRALVPRTGAGCFGKDVQVTVRVAGVWRKIPYSVKDGIVVFEYPIVACGVKFAEEGILKFDMAA